MARGSLPSKRLHMRQSLRRMRAKPILWLSWLCAAAVVVLAARAVAYALSPSPLARALGHEAGGPSLPVISAGAVVVGVALAAAVVGLAAIGVRERALLEAIDAPRLRLGRLAARATALFVVTCLGFAMLESYLHWRAGLGWHGLQCLLGPVHRNAIPVMAALSLVAAALAAALEHVLSWIRRTMAAVERARIPLVFPLITAVPAPVQAPPPARIGSSLGARAPPFSVT
jgi:hypothetical protein